MTKYTDTMDLVDAENRSHKLYMLMELVRDSRRGVKAYAGNETMRNWHQGRASGAIRAAEYFGVISSPCADKIIQHIRMWTFIVPARLPQECNARGGA